MSSDETVSPLVSPTNSLNATALFSPEIRDNRERCLICNEFIKQRAKKYALKDDKWDKFKNHPEEWSGIALPTTHPYFNYGKVSSIVEGVEKAFGSVHASCRATFSSKSHIDRLKETFGERNEVPVTEEIEVPPNEEDTVEVATSSVRQGLRSSVGGVESSKCFICYTETNKDHLLYADGGLTRCSRDSAGKRLITMKDVYLRSGNSDSQLEAAKRLDLILKGDASDIWAADIFTHKSCYLKFAHPYKQVSPELEIEAETLALDTFFYKIKQKVIVEKCAFTIPDSFLRT